MTVTFFDTHTFEKSSLEAANKGRFDLNFLDIHLRSHTAGLAAGSQAVSIFVNDDASAAVLEKLAGVGVKYLALRSAGYNHVDLKRAAELGIKVANVPAYSPYAVAEHTVALMLALNRKLTRAHNRVRELNFSLNGLVGFDMNGKTVGIVGLGRIGTIVARIMNGFGCRLLGFDPYPNEEISKTYGLKYVDLPELLSESNIITLLAPLNNKTRYIINPDTVSQMKRGVMLINTSRGGLVDTKAVIDGLKSGQIGYLGIDVYEQEQDLFFRDQSDRILQDDLIARLMTFQNVLITSHQGFLTDTALENIADTTFQNLSSWAEGKPAENEIE